MKKTIAAAVAAGLIIGAPVLAQETFTGVWVVTTHVPDVETEDLMWTVTEVDGAYVVTSEGGNAAMISALGAPKSSETVFDGTTFTMTTTYGVAGADDFVIVNSGVIDGDTFEGTSKFGIFGEYRLTGERR